MIKQTHKDGFSLVELSIVLVILGLLTGGILTGQNLIHAAELRSVTTEAESLKAAIYTFRDKYFYLPGDMPNAFDFWGTAVGCTDTIVSDANPNGCNGNGNSLMDDHLNAGEDLRAVQFLALTGLIEGSYTGLIEASGNKRQRGINVIKSRYPQGVAWLNVLFAAQFGVNGNNISYGAEGADFPDSVLFTPEDAWNIDTKLDDGRPGMGVVMSPEGQATCHDNVDYALASDTVGCILILWLK